jgi:nitric oxide reductase subunit C
MTGGEGDTMLKLSGVLGMLGLGLLLLSALQWPLPAAGTSSPGDAEAALRGAALFRDKGCAMCHLNRRLEGRTGEFGFAVDLTSYTNDEAFLQRWLADPRAVRPGTEMPTLNLSEQEIADLIAFLNAPR